MPNINEMLLKLEGFQYDTSLDLNMGYYIIQLSDKASKLCSIIHPRGKYRYKHLPLVIYNSPDILQQKMNDLFHAFTFIRACIENLLILKKGDWTDHAHKQEFTPNKMNGKGLKCNIEISFFGQTKMEYLGFWVTCDGVKTINNKNKYESTYFLKRSTTVYRCSELLPCYVAILLRTLENLTKITSSKVTFK